MSFFFLVRNPDTLQTKFSLKIKQFEILEKLLILNKSINKTKNIFIYL